MQSLVRRPAHASNTASNQNSYDARSTEFLSGFYDMTEFRFGPDLRLVARPEYLETFVKRKCVPRQDLDCECFPIGDGGHGRSAVKWL